MATRKQRGCAAPHLRCIPLFFAEVQPKTIDKTVEIWDTETKEELMTLEGGTHRPRSVAFSADGRRIASGCLDGKVIIWNSDDWE